MVVEICPSVSPRRMNSDSQAGHKGTTASRSSKRSKAECRDRVRTWAKPSPLGHDWMPLCVGKRRTDRQISHPEPRDALAVLPPHQRHARSFPAERSIAARGRTSTSAAQAEAERNALGLPCGVKASAEGVSRAWAIRAQRVGDQVRVVPA